ncbi:MAG: tetratricopeptide repeat protein [Acidobacteriota bacterium]|nr:tetratricopeptide repeat protein [Acidobacteriota bacterium]MDE3265941.1 tetratricopeptide repeat protein [Acidobacteriota bacterium]
MQIRRNVALSTCAALVAAAALASDEEGLAAFEAPDAEYRRALASTLMAAGLAAEGAPAREKFYSSAVKVADSLVGLDPSYESLLLLGQAHLATETYDQAVSTFRRAISIDPRHWRAHCNLGQVLTRQGRYRAAKKEFKTALRLAAGSDQNVVWSWLGNLYWQQQRYTRAERAWEKAGEFAPPARVRERIRRQQFGYGMVEVNHPRRKGPAWLPHGSPAPVPVDG